MQFHTHTNTHVHVTYKYHATSAQMYETIIVIPREREIERVAAAGSCAKEDGSGQYWFTVIPLVRGVSPRER